MLPRPIRSRSATPARTDVDCRLIVAILEFLLAVGPLP
jgi:hypothetical protein